MGNPCSCIPSVDLGIRIMAEQLWLDIRQSLFMDISESITHHLDWSELTNYTNLNKLSQSLNYMEGFLLWEVGGPF